MGTRSWSFIQSFSVGEIIYVEAAYFDNDKEEVKYSDHFQYKEKTLLEGVILSAHQKSVQVKFDIDNTTASVPFAFIKKITEENIHLVFKTGNKVSNSLLILSFLIFYYYNGWQKSSYNITSMI